MSFHIGTFHFGDFHFDAILVRRVSLWRASTSARFSLARFHFGAFLFGAFPNFVRTYDDPVGPICERQFRADYLCACFLSTLKSCQPLFAREAYLFCAHVSFRSSVVSILRACFLSANCFLRQFGAYLFLRSVSICAHVSYLRRSVFYASWTHFSFCAYVDRICEYGV